MMKKFLLLIFVLLRLAADDFDLSTPQPLPQPSWLTLDKSHKYLGWATLAMAAATVAVAPEEDENKGDFTLHRTLAYTTAGLSIASVLSGFLFHGDDYGLEYSISDYDNIHVIMAVAGGILMTSAAVIGNSSEAHSKLGIAGAVLMGSAIVIEW